MNIYDVIKSYGIYSVNNKNKNSNNVNNKNSSNNNVNNKNSNNNNEDNENNIIKKNTNSQSNSIFDTSNFYFEHFNKIELLFQKTSNEVIESEFNKIIDSFSKNKFNDLFESVAYAYINNRFEFEKRKFNIVVYYLLFKIYPYLIYGSMLFKTIDEQIKFINELEKIDKQKQITISSYTININKYKNYLLNYYSNYQTNTININFNNFIGIDFHETGLSYNEVLKYSNNLLIIHVGFNNNFDNVLYKSYRGINKNFLTYEDMCKFKITEPIKTHKKNLCFELMDNEQIIYDSRHIRPVDNNIDIDNNNIDIDNNNINIANNNNNFNIDNININIDNITIYDNTIDNIINMKNKLSNDLNKKYYIVICYDDDDNLEKCRYSISSNSFNFGSLNILINGGIIYPLPSEIYKLYFSKMFYIRKNMLIDNEANKDQEISKTQLLKFKFAKIIRPCFNENYKIAIDNICKEFPNEKYLKLYLEGLKNECDENGRLIFEQYYEYVKLYFFPIIL